MSPIALMVKNHILVYGSNFSFNNGGHTVQRFNRRGYGAMLN